MGWAIVTGAGRTVSLISSLIHVRVAASITVHDCTLSRTIDRHGRFWTVVPHPEKRKVSTEAKYRNECGLTRTTVDVKGLQSARSRWGADLCRLVQQSAAA